MDGLTIPGRQRASGPHRPMLDRLSAPSERLVVGAASTGAHRPYRPSLELSVAAVGGGVGHRGGGSPQLRRQTEPVPDLEPDCPFCP